MLNRRVATQSFAQPRGTGATPTTGAKAGATQGNFTTSDAIPWKPVDPKNHPGLEMLVVWGNPNGGVSLIMQKYPAGMDSGWHWHTVAYLRSRSCRCRIRTVSSRAAVDDAAGDHPLPASISR